MLKESYPYYLANQPEQPNTDLEVTDLWQDGAAIWYQIANTGPITTPADHYSLLTIDGIREAEDGIKVALGPGETMNRSFPYAYACSGAYRRAGKRSAITGGRGRSSRSIGARSEPQRSRC